jgi:hypothetical protein
VEDQIRVLLILVQRLYGFSRQSEFRMEARSVSTSHLGWDRRKPSACSDGKKQQKSGGDSSDTLPPLCLEETHGGFSIFSVSCHVLSRSYLALARHSSRISVFCYRNLSNLSQRIAEHPAREQNNCFVETTLSGS